MSTSKSTAPPPSRDPSPVGPPLRASAQDVGSHVATVRALSARGSGAATSDNVKEAAVSTLGAATAAFIGGTGDGGDPEELFKKRLRGLEEAARAKPGYMTYGQLANFIADIYPARKADAKQCYEHCLTAWRAERDVEKARTDSNSSAAAGAGAAAGARALDTKVAAALAAAKHYDFTTTLYVSLYAEFLKNADRDFHRAAQLYEEILETNPRDPLALGNYAVLLHRCHKDYDRAEAQYKKAIELYPSHASILNFYATFLKSVRKDYEQARAFYKRAVSINPRHADALGNYAVLLHCSLREYGHADTQYLLALKADPFHANNHGNYALFLSEVKQDYDAAVQHYKQSLNIDPSHPNTLYNYGVLLDSVFKKYEEASGLYERAIKAKPDHTFALHTHAVLQEEIFKNFEKAGDLYSKALASSPKDCMVLNDFANFTNRALKDPTSAADLYRRSLERQPNQANILYDFANMLRYELGTGTTGVVRSKKASDNPYDLEAEKIYQRLLELEPAHASALGELAQLAFDLRDDVGNAKVLFDQATSGAPSPTSSKGKGGRRSKERCSKSDPSLPTPRTLTMHAKFLVHIREIAAAERKFKQAVAADGTHLGTLVEYANFLIAVRCNYKSASRYVSLALKVAPTNPDARVLRAILKWKHENDTEQAMKELGAVVQKNPKHKWAQKQLEALSRAC